MLCCWCDEQIHGDHHIVGGEAMHSWCIIEYDYETSRFYDEQKEREQKWDAKDG